MDVAKGGTYADLIAAVSTTLALIGAAIAVYYTHAASKREAARDDRYDLQQLRAQASKVAIWDNYSHDSRGFTVRNASDLPVYHVTVFVWKMSLEREPGVIPWLALDCDLVPPGTHFYRPGLREATGELLYGFQFLDANGQEWNRDVGGTLEQGKLVSNHHLVYDFEVDSTMGPIPENERP